jgi:hypothetical protein
VDTCFFESLEGCRLGMGQPWFCSPFGKDPAALASLNQEKFNLAPTGPEANRSHLLAPAELAQVRQAKKLDRLILVL